MNKLMLGDCADVLKTLPDNSLDSLVTDPPAGISFMGKSWDGDKGGRKQWCEWMEGIMRECYRVLKPGAHGLVWALPRTSHWTATALEDAGFEVRDCISHIFGSGFPKSLNVRNELCKQHACQFIETAKLAGLKYERFPVRLDGEKTDSVVVNVAILHEGDPENPTGIGVVVDSSDQTATSLFVSTELIDSSTTLSLRASLADLLKEESSAITLTRLKTTIDLKIWSLLQYQNTLASIINLNGTSLKPAAEFWYLVRKPLSEKTVAANVLEWGTGGLNIDGSRIEAKSEQDLKLLRSERPSLTSNKNEHSLTHGGLEGFDRSNRSHVTGRFPANLVLSHSEHCTDNQCDFHCAVKALDAQSLAGGMHGAGKIRAGTTGNGKGLFGMGGGETPRLGDSGGASRFFFQARWDKNADAWPLQESVTASANSAANGSSSLGLRVLDSVQRLAAIVEPLEGTALRDSTVPFILETLSELRPNETPNIEKIQSSAQRFLLELLREKSTPQSHAQSAVTQGLTDIITTIQNPSRSNGYVESATSDTTPPNSARGAKGFASRFIYCAKISSSERNAAGPNGHPTVKPKKLMTYLIRMITPPGGTVIDPFMGSGSTGVAAKEAGFQFIGIEREQEYFEIARARIG